MGTPTKPDKPPKKPRTREENALIDLAIVRLKSNYGITYTQARAFIRKLAMDECITMVVIAQRIMKEVPS